MRRRLQRVSLRSPDRTGAARRIDWRLCPLAAIGRRGPSPARGEGRRDPRDGPSGFAASSPEAGIALRVANLTGAEGRGPSCLGRARAAGVVEDAIVADDEAIAHSEEIHDRQGDSVVADMAA